MSKKYKLKKEIYIIFVIVILLFITISILINKNINKSYSIDYTVDNYDISENYISTNNLYYFDIKDNNISYDFIINNKIKEKKLINKIIKHEDEEYICLEIISDYFDTYPLCSKDKENIDYRLVNDNMKEELESYYNNQENYNDKLLNYNIYNEDIDLFIWSYKGFNYIKGNNIKSYNIFKKDIYNIPISVKINNYIVVADYEQKYEFNKVYIIDLEKDVVKEWELDNTISFDSYIAGINDKSIFIVDTKSKKEYELVPHKQKMRIVGTESKKGIIYQNGEIQKMSITKIISNKEKFIYKNNYIYESNGKKLYLKYAENTNKTLINKHDVDKIIDIKNDTIYYISSNSLYRYNLKYGEVKILSYSELEFNKENMIIINN